jgi:hypothetical protein
MGAPPEVIEKAQRNAELEEEIFEVWDENWNSVLFFLACATQWVVGGMGGYIGMNYPGVESVMRIKRSPDREALFADLQVMEFAALEVLNKKED